MPRLVALLLALTPTAPPATECLLVEISAVGPSAHGATVLRHAAPHRLIRALDRLPQWVEAAEGIHGGRIVALAGALAINVIPPRAAAEVELRLSASVTDPAAALQSLDRALGKEVELRRLDRACEAQPELD
ncbi:MAG: peptidase dimerization domain-containing protein [Acidobacteria bacterium]|nr:peptidase dimerization domain-containing protein [Acidobacteriota bacterium]